MSEELHDTLDAVIKCVDYIKARPLNQRLFSRLCNEMGSDHTGLLLHSEARWLSKGQGQKRIVELQEEVTTFLRKQKQTFLPEQFSQEKFMASVTYLADIFDSLNSLNQSMQGPVFTVIDHNSKITAYYKNLILWQSYVKRNEYDIILQLKAYLSEKNVNMKEIITGHLEQRTKNLEHYYDVAIMPTNKQDWMIDPFAVANFPELPLCVAEELMDLTSEASNRLSFESFKKKHPTLPANIYFWVSMRTVYPA